MFCRTDASLGHDLLPAMPLVEVLTTSTSLQPGWTYVPDNGFDPSKAAIKPGLGRKRTVRDGGRTDLTSRENTAIVRHLAELDRENHRDVQIPIPTRQPKDAAARGMRYTSETSFRFLVKGILANASFLPSYQGRRELRQPPTSVASCSRRRLSGIISTMKKPLSRKQRSINLLQQDTAVL